MVRIGFVCFFIICGLWFTGCEELPCNKSVDQEIIDAVDQAQLKIDLDSIDAYLANKGITPLIDPSGIRYVVKKEGFGGTPCLENQVTFINRGSFLRTDKSFENSVGEVQLKGLILGWQIMLPQFAKGAKVVLYIPSVFAYGTEGKGVIPPNANLIFDIEITNIR